MRSMYEAPIIEWEHGVCDATARIGRVARIDVETSELGLPFIQLLEPAWHRYRTCSLRPTEWIRLAVRMGSQHVAIGPEHYWRYGTSYYTGLRCTHQFRSDVNGVYLRRLCKASVQWLVYCGIAFEGEDLFAKKRQDQMIAVIAERYGADSVMSIVDEILRWPRRNQMNDENVYAFLLTSKIRVGEAWLLQRWRERPNNAMLALLRLSENNLSADIIKKLMIVATKRVPTSERRLMWLEWGAFAKTHRGVVAKESVTTYLDMLDKSDVDEIRTKIYEYAGLR